MSTRTALVLMIVLAFIGPNRGFKRRLTIELNNFTCTAVMPSMWHEFSCILYRKRIRPMSSIRFNLKQTITNFSMIFEMDVLKKDNTKMNLARNKLDGCKFLNSSYGHSIYSKFFKRIQATSNLPRNCPIEANKLFEVRNYTELGNEYPSVIPALSHQFRLKMLVEDNVFGEILLAGTMKH